MERMNFSLPAFQRTIWASTEARFVWEPRIQRISRMQEKLEHTLVIGHWKPVALQVVSPERLPELNREMSERGLIVTPLARQGTSNGYQNGAIPTEEGKPWVYRVAIGKMDAVQSLSTYWAAQDDEGIGRILGYPECCRENFVKYWVKDGVRDPILGMIWGGDIPVVYKTGSYASSNILLRHLGVRAVSHLPCCFGCTDTGVLGATYREIARKSFPEESEWLWQILNWPMKWTSLHGIAEITTPVLKLIHDTDALPSTVTIEKAGKSYPEEGARGNQFPFENIMKLQIPNTWSDNGFPSKEVMDRAHDMVLEVIPSDILSVMDLGCGSGVLLQKICHKIPTALPYGIECRDRIADMASKRLRVPIQRDDIFNLRWFGSYDVILIARQRFEEAPSRIRLMEELLSKCKTLVIYDYSAMTVEVTNVSD